MIELLEQNTICPDLWLIKGRDILSDLEEYGIEIESWSEIFEFYEITVTDEESQTMLKLMS